MKGNFNMSLMSNAEKVKANNTRIALLKSRGETMNQRLINKLIRRNRILSSKD
jgi:hypothetical protein